MDGSIFVSMSYTDTELPRKLQSMDSAEAVKLAVKQVNQCNEPAQNVCLYLPFLHSLSDSSVSFTIKSLGLCVSRLSTRFQERTLISPYANTCTL